MEHKTQIEKHTKTPWYADGMAIRSVETDMSVAAVGINSSDKDFTANAAFIVNACNAHNELVSTLEHIATMAKLAQDSVGFVDDPWQKALQMASRKATEALSKLEK